MWLFVFFDLPTETKRERKAAADFRKSADLKEVVQVVPSAKYPEAKAEIMRFTARMKRKNRFITL